MTYGLTTFAGNKEVPFLGISPFNPVYAVTIERISTTTLQIALPAGTGTLMYTSTLDREKDRTISAGGASGAKGSINNVTFSGNTAVITLTEVTSGISSFSLTFYRRRD